MKILIAAVSILIILFLADEAIYAQKKAEPKRKTQVQNQSDVTYMKGLEYAVEGEFEKAKLEFVNILKFNPFYELAKSSLKIINDFMDQKIEKETGIHMFKGISYYIEVRYDEANNQFYKATEISPEYAVPYNFRGIIYSIKGKYEKAISEYTKAVEIDSIYADVYINRGIAYHKLNNLDQAITEFNKAIEIDSIYALAYFHRGNVYYELDEYEQTISDYTKAIEINPKFIEVYKNRANIYHKYLKDDHKACADLKTACELGDCEDYNNVREIGDCK